MQRFRIKSLTNDTQPVSVSEDPASDLFAKLKSTGEQSRADNHFLGLVLDPEELLEDRKNTETKQQAEKASARVLWLFFIHKFDSMSQHVTTAITFLHLQVNKICFLNINSVKYIEALLIFPQERAKTHMY